MYDFNTYDIGEELRQISERARFFQNIPDSVDVTISCSLNDLRNLVRGIVEEVTAKQKPKLTPAAKYLTTEEVCKRFRIGRVTLWRWNKNNWLVPVNFEGKQKLYRLQDIEEYERKARLPQEG